jgi:hypothetical protein
MSWLDDLKPGDRVIFSNRSLRRVSTVGRTTKTLIILDDGGRFRKTDGFSPGGNVWDLRCIKQLTPAYEDEILEERRRTNMVDKLNRTFWTRLPTETLEKVLALLNVN